jgi:AcrR family transcriptional regulator
MALYPIRDWRIIMNKKAEKILSKTIQLFIREGIKKTTMDDIAENSRVSKVTIYKYFTDKDTLYLAVGKQIFSHYTSKLNNVAASEEFLITRLYDYLRVISEFINTGQFDLGMELTRYHPDVETEYQRYLQTYRGSLLALIDNGMKNDLFKSNLARDMIFHYIDMGIVYYQQSPAYRYKILNDNNFRQQFLLFHISNIFIEGEKMLPASGKVD